LPAILIQEPAESLIETLHLPASQDRCTERPIGIGIRLRALKNRRVTVGVYLKIDIGSSWTAPEPKSMFKLM
jgi:hypothetical protein